MKINPEAQLAVKLYRAYLEAHVNDGLNDPNAPVTDIKALCEKSERNSVADAAKLCSLARALHRLDETACNRGLTVREIKRQEDLYAAVLQIAVEYGMDTREVKFNSDPRGYAVYLHFPDGSYNSWGGAETGWGI